MKFKFIIPAITILSIVLAVTFFTTYNSAKNGLLDIGSEIFEMVNKDAVGFIQAMNEQVDAGRLSLEEAQEIVRTYFHGPKTSDGTRDMSQSKMSPDKNIRIWAFMTKGDNKGILSMHYDREGTQLWDYQIDGKYTTRDTWTNIEKTGRIIKEIWQESPADPIEKWIAYQTYYEPWDWIIATGQREDILYSQRLNSLLVQLVITFIILIFMVIIFVYYIQNTNNTLKKSIGMLKKSSEQIIAGSQQVSSASQSLAQASSEQAASMEETTSSLEEMASMTRQNADNARQADNLMKDVGKVVEKANISMSELTTSMEEICMASEETSKIIKTIDEIAFQTNLLSLNAAVEAARAGEAGAGFAVVADEVKNLAMRSAEAAKSTSSLIEGTVNKIESGSELVTHTNNAFSEVTEISVKIGDLVGEIAAASDEQARGIEQLNNGAIQMDKITQSNAANAEETSSASEQMYTQAKQMKKFVESLSAILSSKIEDDIDDNSWLESDSEIPSFSEPDIKAKKAPAVSYKKEPAYNQDIVKDSFGKDEIRPEDIIPFDDDFKDF